MLLEPMLSRLAASKTIEDTLRTGLRDFIALHGAEMGDVQLLDGDGHLVIVEAWNLSNRFLEVFADLDAKSGSVCTRAAGSGAPLFIPDVSVDPDFAPYAAFAAKVPFKAVLSCPLISARSELIGVVSALSANDFRPTKMEMSAAERYARQLADAIAARTPDRSVFAKMRARELRSLAGAA